MGADRMEAQKRTRTGNGSKYGLDSAMGKPEGSAAEFVEAVNVELLRDAIARIVGAGDALMFSATSDGGALVMLVMEGGDKRKVYITSDTKLHDVLKSIVQ